MHPNGQLPAYEFAFGDVNPPVHAWAAWRVYKIAVGPRGQRDRAVPGADVPEAAAQLHLVGEPQGRRGRQPVLRRVPRARQHRRVRSVASRCPRAATSSRPTAPPGWPSSARRCCRWRSSWRETDPAYEDMASKFFEHFVAHRRRDEHARRHGPLGRDRRLLLRPAARRRRPRRRCASARWSASCRSSPSRCWRSRSSIGCPASSKRMRWFLDNRRDLAGRVAFCDVRRATRRHVLLAIPSRERLVARAALHARRARVPVALRHPLDCRRSTRSSPTVFDFGGADADASTTSRANRRSGSSAATRTGAARSGCRSTTCSSRRSSATTTSTATTCGSSARPAPGSC